MNYMTVVQGWRKRRPNLAPDEIQAIRDLRATGMTQQAIADKLDISRSAVRNHLDPKMHTRKRAYRARCAAEPDFREQVRTRDRERRATEPEWRESQVERLRERNATPGHRERERRRRLWRYYGITLEQYERMLEAQGGACVICERPPDETALAVDHDHDCCPSKNTCGKCLRGLLCFFCNTRLASGLKLSETLLSRREFNYVHLWRKRISRERSNPWDEIREPAA